MKTLFLSLLLIFSTGAMALPSVELDMLPHTPDVNSKDKTFNKGHTDEFTVHAPWIHSDFTVRNHLKVSLNLIAAEFTIYQNGGVLWDQSFRVPSTENILRSGHSYTFHDIYLDGLPALADKKAHYTIRYRVMGWTGTPDSRRSQVDVFTDFETH